MDVAYEWVQTNIISVINGAIAEYGGDDFILFVMLISCITLLFLNKEQMKRAYRLIALYSALLIAFVLLNPFVISRFEFLNEAVSVFPICVTIAYVTSTQTSIISNSIKRHSVILALTALLFVAGMIDKKDEFFNPVNAYKVDDQGIILADFIEEDSGGKPVTVYYILRGGEHLGDDISACGVAEQYSGFIRAESLQLSSNLIEIKDADYIVINNEIIGADCINKTGYILVFDSGYYSVFFHAK